LIIDEHPKRKNVKIIFSDFKRNTFIGLQDKAKKNEK